ncbi:UBX domain-containing protein 4 isoform X2 [Oryzias melastigma]|uniref:UBX domain-containing protein 4 n=1 Tax=Oryzias melastigma TaxID=30732 RepID=A0A3B3DSD7_ORYME|nr:UBX domain-containing protein 4 isoform X2 [Oryzias melastigma]
MLWFEGSIPEAISSAKSRGLVFVVVVSGDDEQSAQLMSSWEDERVSEAAHSCCVAIKVSASSETCVQFSQIYPVVCIPSSFFIGNSGIPLEVIAGGVTPQELLKRILNVSQMHSQKVQGGPGEASSSSHTAPGHGSDSEPPSGSAAAERSDEVCRPPSSRTPSEEDSAQHAAAGPEAEENLEEKVERLTKKLEERREQRKRGEEETEVRKEVERRKMGRNMQDFKKKQEEEKTKRLLEERNREKAEEKAARERVRQQIAMDRADRAARYAKTQEEERAAKEALLQARQEEQEARKEAQLRQRSAVARIQFRLPDGSSFSNQFPSQSRLQEAWDFAAQEVGSRYGNFSLATMFPRREFTAEDLNRTLLELELVPSASVVLRPLGRPAGAVVQSSGRGLWAALGTLLYPLLAVWRFLSSFLFATPAPSAAPPRASPPEPNTHNQPPSSSDKAKRDSEKRPKDFKKDGNIHRLRTQEDSEDDNNTWNGNSTQQM